MPKDFNVDGYDKTSAESIFDHALKLTGKSLSEAAELPLDVVNLKDRGKLGTLVERYYFKHKPPNDHNPDFKEAGVELKVTGVLKNKDGKYVGKERLVLTMINYEQIASETWDSNAFLNKCKKMLIMFYLYSKEVPVIERKFVLNPLMYEIPAEDLHVIRGDWEKIRNKVLDGKAHELSEGDTFYLGACRKGAGGEKEKPRKQPFSNIKAPARAFSLKQGYLNQLISANQSDVPFGVPKLVTIEDEIADKFSKFLGMSVAEISSEVNYLSKSKHLKWLLSRRILAGQGLSIEEFEKADIQLKTVSLSKQGGCREDMSFPAFKCIDVASQDWEDSDFSYQVESKFLFVVFKEDEAGIDRLHKVMYWNMPYQDRLEARKVWDETKQRILVDATKLPSRRENFVAHVRPHAKNKKDVDLTPQGELIVKRCFWLNGSYIAKVVA